MGVRQKGLALALLAACLHPSASVGAEPTVAYQLLCGETLTIWRKTRDAGTRECCARVARARASLWTGTAKAREQSAQAVRLCPSGLEALTTLAAASHAAGQFEEAHGHFQRAAAGTSADDWSHLPPSVLLLAARAAALANERPRALEHYRAVILDLERIPSAHERARLLLEAALVAARSTPPRTAEAHAYFRQSADHPSPRLEAVRALIAPVLGLAGEPDAQPTEQAELDDARDVVRWMQGSAGPARGAPGELLPVLSRDLLAELLPPEPSVVEEEP